MAVFRVERNKGYTVMSNHHLRNKELSLKAKGLLSQMLSLPEDWDYTLAGLSFINREKIDAIREAIKELERAGYIVRSRERDEKGRLRGADYVIYAPHAPDALEDAYNVQRDPFFDLALCGHTHGGQVTLLGFAPYTASRRGLRYGNHYRSGEIEEHGVTVLVSNGVGTTWLPLRLGARAQYHLITLSRARAQ